MNSRLFVDLAAFASCLATKNGIGNKRAIRKKGKMGWTRRQRKDKEEKYTVSFSFIQIIGVMGVVLNQNPLGCAYVSTLRCC